MEAAMIRTRMLRALSSRQLLHQSRSLGGSGSSSSSVRGIASPAEALSYHPMNKQQQTATSTGSPPLPGVPFPPLACSSVAVGCRNHG